MDDYIESCSAAAPNVQPGRRGGLSMNHAHERLGHRLSDGQYVLKPRPAALIAVLHKQPILIVLVHVHAAGGIAQVPIEGINAVPKIVELLQTVPLLIKQDEIRISLGREPLGVDFKRQASTLGRSE